MVYDTKAIIPVEIGEPTSKIANMTLNQNKENIRLELDLIEERREVFFVKDVVLKRKIAIKYNKKAISCAFKKDNSILHKVDIGGKNNHEGKLVENWERPYKVVAKTKKGAYIL